jgi:hypothetical protein
LRLRRAVLVIERHGRAVLDRLLEVVDRDVIAEDFLRPFLAAINGVPVRARNIAFGNALRMFTANVSY